MVRDDLIYLDSAATSLKPKVVVDTVMRFYSHEYGTVHRGVYSLSRESTLAYSEVREEVRRFIGAKEVDEIVFTKGTTESINLVASSFGKAFLQPGDEVVITEMEHHSNIVPWQLICQERGARLKVAPVREDGELNLEALASMLTKRTKLVSCTHASNVLGTINPIAEIAALAHESGALLFVDGAQMAPHAEIDVQALQADFYAFSSHKMYGPTGIGILYGRKEVLRELPPYQSGGDMVREVSFEKTTFQDVPLKFEAGTPPIASVMGLGAAIRYLKRVGARSEEAELVQYALQRLKDMEGVEVLGRAEKRVPLISFTVEGAHPLDIGMMLDAKGICVRTGNLCAQPLLRRFGFESVVRLSLGLYTTRSEIDKFCEALSSVVHQMRSVSG